MGKMAGPEDLRRFLNTVNIWAIGQAGQHDLCKFFGLQTSRTEQRTEYSAGQANLDPRQGTDE